MKQTETAIMLKTIKTAYPYFEITPEVVRLWHEMIQNMPYEKAQKHLREHISSSKYAPTIAEIVRHEPQQYTDYERLKLETAERFAEMEEWELNATPMPEHLRPNMLTRGVQE